MNPRELAETLDEVAPQLQAVAAALDLRDASALRVAAHKLRVSSDTLSDEWGVAQMLSWSGEQIEEHADADPPRWDDAWAAYSFATTFLGEARSEPGKS